MKLSDFYPNLNIDFKVNFITTNINKIKKNCIFINLQNHTNIVIHNSILESVFIVSQAPIISENTQSIVVLNLKEELVRLYKKFYNLSVQNTKLIGILNDDFYNYSKVIYDLFNDAIKDKIEVINSLDDIDAIYELIGKYSRKKVKYIFVLFHSSELIEYAQLLYFDYIILPKFSHTTSLKAIMNMNLLLSNSGILINNYDDFKDFFIPNSSVTFGFSSESTYHIRNIRQHNKIITGTIYKNHSELSELLLCLSNYDYIYFILSLFVFVDNEYQTTELVHIFFSKYIL